MLLTGVFVNSSVQLILTLTYGYIFLKHSNIVCAITDLDAYIAKASHMYMQKVEPCN